MTDQRLRELASESDDVQAMRKTLQHEVDILRKGLEKVPETPARPQEQVRQPVSPTK